MQAPRVEFHSGLGEPLQYACRLLRKAWQQRVRVAVTAPQHTLLALDRELWTFEPGEFLPHRRVGAQSDDGAARRLTPIWLCEAEVPADAPAVLVNIGMPAPAEPQRFERIIELVGSEAQARDEARARWRGYEALGLNIEHHDRGALK